MRISGTHRPGREKPNATALTLLILSFCGLGGCRGGSSPPTATDPAAAPVGGPTGRFVGSEACRPCHEDVYTAWMGSRHHRTLQAVSAEVRPRLAGQPLPGGFSIDEGGTVTGPGHEGRPVQGSAAYVVGGRHREDLWVRMTDGRLQVFPLSFDVDSGQPFEPIRVLQGDVPPAPDTLDYWTRSGRSADVTCYGCHATAATITVSGASPAGNGVPRSRWTEAGVGCEACHGPGGRHVDEATAGAKKPGALLHTGWEESAAVGVCGSCHGLRQTLSSPFSPSPAHGYGRPLGQETEPVLRVSADAEFRFPLFPDLRPATYQQEAVAFGQSRCATKGGMTCKACHDTHSGALLPAATSPDACAPCHAAITRNAADHTRHKSEGQGTLCVDCHMAPIVRGPGREAARDHTLAPPVAGAGQIPAACANCHADGAKVKAIFDSWAAWNPNGAGYRKRAGLLAAFLDAERGAPHAAGRLAQVAKDMEQSWFARFAAITSIQGLLDLDPAQRGDDEVAAAVRVAMKDPHPAVRRAAIRALGRTGSPADGPALAAITDGDDLFMALEAVGALSALGAPDAGARLAALLRSPSLAAEYRAQTALGSFALAARDYRSAERALTKAVELYPYSAVALNDLGIARINLGNLDAARTAWGQALELNPRLEAARRNLDQTAKARSAIAPTVNP